MPATSFGISIHRFHTDAVLEYAEQNATGGLLKPPIFEGHAEEQVEYRVALCAEAKFLRCSADMYIVSLTWAGHEGIARWRSQASHNC